MILPASPPIDVHLPALPGSHPDVAVTAAAARTIVLESRRPSGDPSVDRLTFRFYPARAGSQDRPQPAVVLLPPIGSTGERDPMMRRIANDLASHGFHCALLLLPYHGARRPQGWHVDPAEFFLSGDARRAAAAFAQGASDVTTVVDWLFAEQRRDEGIVVDPARVGVLGISLGAIVAHLAMGQNSRLTAGVAILGGGDLPDLYHRSLLASIERLLHPSAGRGQTEAERREILAPVDPLTDAGRNRPMDGGPRRVLMIDAARDPFIPPEDALTLWRALGRPRLIWLDTGHMALTLVVPAALRTARAYLENVWSGRDDAPVPQLTAPTFKLGLLAEPERGDNHRIRFSLAFTWQAFSLGRQRAASGAPLPLLHGDLGLTPRGLFTALGFTVTPFIDVGIADPIAGRLSSPRPYVSLHLVY